MTGCPGLMFEIKYGATRYRVAEWLQETLEEQYNARADHGILVIKPPDIGERNVHLWHAVMQNQAFNLLWEQVAVHPTMGVFVDHGEPRFYRQENVQEMLMDRYHDRARDPSHVFVMTTMAPGDMERPDKWYRIMMLGHMVRMLRAAGYGSPNYDRVQGVQAG